MTNRWVMLVLVFIARLSFGFQFQAIAAVGPALVDDLHLSYAQLGWLIGLYSLPGTVVAFPGGMLGRRFGERPVAVAGLALMVAGALITGWSTTFTVAGIGRALSGAGFVTANTVFSKMVADWFAGKEIATAMGVLLTAWPTGIALALVSLGSLASAVSWRIAIDAGALVAAIGLVLILTLYRRPPTAPAAAPVMLAMIPRRDVRLAVTGGITWGALNAALLVLVGFTPSLLVAHGASVAQAGAIVSLTLWVTLVSIPLGGQLVDRMGHADYVIVFGAVATALCIGALAGFAAPAFWCVMIAVTIAPLPGAIVALLPRTVPAGNLATAFGVFYSVYYVVVALAQPLAGFVRDRSSDEAGPVVFAAVLMGVTAVAHLVFIAMRATKVPERA